VPAARLFQDLACRVLASWLDLNALAGEVAI